MCRSPHTTWASRNAITIGHWINPWNELIVAEGMEGAYSGMQYALDLNFGELEFDFKTRSIQVRVHGLDESTPLLSQKWTMDELSGLIAMNETHLQPKDFAKLADQSGQWVCSHYRGAPHPMHSALAQLASIATMTFFLFLPFSSTLISILIFRRKSAAIDNSVASK